MYLPKSNATFVLAVSITIWKLSICFYYTAHKIFVWKSHKSFWSFTILCAGVSEAGQENMKPSEDRVLKWRPRGTQQVQLRLLNKSIHFTLCAKTQGCKDWFKVESRIDKAPNNSHHLLLSAPLPQTNLSTWGWSLSWWWRCALVWRLGC